MFVLMSQSTSNMISSVRIFLTLYLDVDDSRDSLPGTEQNTSVGATFNIPKLINLINDILSNKYNLVPGSFGHQSLVLRPPHTNSFLMENSGGMKP